MNFEYLVFNAIVLGSSTAGALLYPKARWPHFKSAIQAVVPVALVFILWDMFVTEWWWFFNDRYILGLFVGSIPLEEALFFFTVPWSTLVLWENLQAYRGKSTWDLTPWWLLIAIISGGVSLANSWWYTLSVSIGLALITLWDHFHTPKLLADRLFQQFLVLIVVLTTIFNGYLTARPIVEYNALVKSGWHIFTIPVEDYLYGILLLTMVLWIYERRRPSQRDIRHTKKMTN